MAVIALEQVDAVPGAVEQNTSDILSRAHAALLAGANVVVFPELANSGYVVDPGVVARTAQPLDGPLVESLSRLTRRLGGLVATGFCESTGDTYFNSVVLVGADGPVLHYRKLHLFDREREAFSAGDTLPIVETEFGVLGICICYDLRFVEVLRVLALRGADIVLAPAAWVGGFDASVPATGLVRQAEAVVVQANLNQVAVVAVSQVSEAPRDGVRTLGGSIAVDAFGTLLAGPLSRSLPGSATVTVDVAAGRAAQVRGERIRPRQDRRSDVYGLLYGEAVL